MMHSLGVECPKCNAPISHVVLTKLTEDGERVRRRRCLSCNHRFYTGQPKENILESWQVAWQRRLPHVLVKERHS